MLPAHTRHCPEVLSEKNNIAQSYKDHILKHASMLRNPLYDLGRAAGYLEQWVNGLLPPGQLLDISAFRVCNNSNMSLASFKRRSFQKAQPEVKHRQSFGVHSQSCAVFLFIASLVLTLKVFCSEDSENGSSR